MSRKRVAFLFIAYFVVAWVCGVFLLPASEWRYGLVAVIFWGNGDRLRHLYDFRGVAVCSLGRARVQGGKC